MEEKIKQLDILQAELREQNVATMTDAEYEIFKQKHEKVKQLINEIYEFEGVN